MEFDIVDAKWFLSRCESVILLRHKGMTPVKANNIIRGALDRKNLNYNVFGVIASGINRLFGKNTIGEDNTIGKPNSFVTTLICSSIIAWLYKCEGLNLVPKRMNLTDVWPSDILVNKNMKKIIQYKRSK